LGIDMPTATKPTDALLVQATLPAGGAALLPDLVRHLRTAIQNSTVQVHAAFNDAQSMFYAYLHLAERQHLEPSVAASLQAVLKNERPQLQNLRMSRLEKMLDKQGASAGTAPVFHYVVEMDPEAGWMPELSSWYDTEHMPGLATVPGCVRASRYLNHDHGPLSLACYDLVTQETLGSPPWLAVRETEWSSRMRPRFTNTVRTMFDLMDDAEK
jgi:hypothetical protein